MDRTAVLGVGLGDSLEEGVESSGGLLVFFVFLNFIKLLKLIKVQENV